MMNAVGVIFCITMIVLSLCMTVFCSTYAVEYLEERNERKWARKLIEEQQMEDEQEE